MDPNPLTMMINLRGQSEKAATQQAMYEPTRIGGFCTCGSRCSSRGYTIVQS